MLLDGIESVTSMKITPHLDYEVILANRSCPVHFAVQFEAPSVEQARPRPAAFCIVLDRSGSMAGPPLQKAKQATPSFAAALLKFRAAIATAEGDDADR